MRTLVPMKYSKLQAVFVLLQVALLCSTGLPKHYYIVPVNSTDSACNIYQNGTCLTLKQLAQSVLTSPDETNLTLNFLPGEHLLTHSLAIHNFRSIQLSGINESVISFHGEVMIKILDSNYLCIKNLYFVHKTVAARSQQGEQGLNITSGKDIHIYNCSFMGIYNQENNSAAVMISGAKNIILDRFTAKDNHGGVVHIESSCSVTIMNSEFTGNNGYYGVYINSINTVITDSNFNSNTGRVVAINSVTTFITQCNITNNINLEFGNDSSEGGIIHISLDSSSSKLINSMFSNCSLPSSYSVVTQDTAIQISRKASKSLYTENTDIATGTDHMCLENIADMECDFREKSKSTHIPPAENNTTYYCIDFSDVPAPDLRNISDIIYDFTTSNTSGSHDNRGRLCVNTDPQHTLPFTKRLIFCDDKTRVVITEDIIHKQNSNSYK